MLTQWPWKSGLPVIGLAEMNVCKYRFHNDLRVIDGFKNMLQKLAANVLRAMFCHRRFTGVH